MLVTINVVLSVPCKVMWIMIIIIIRLRHFVREIKCPRFVGITRSNVLIGGFLWNSRKYYIFILLLLLCIINKLQQGKIGKIKSRDYYKNIGTYSSWWGFPRTFSSYYYFFSNRFICFYLISMHTITYKSYIQVLY